MAKLIKSLGFALVTALTITAVSGLSANAGNKQRTYKVSEIVERLKDRGFYGIRVTDKYPPYYDMYVCHAGKRYELTIDYKGNIRDKDREGRCRVKKN